MTKWGKVSRREGIALHPKADKVLKRRTYGPGQHGAKSRRKLSQYSVQLREKQKVRRMYGLSEDQFRRFFRNASKKKGVTGEELLKNLELRLDNTVYRLSLAGSRPMARQMIGHGHIKVNGKKVTIPSYILKEGDEVSVSEKASKNKHFEEHKEKISSDLVPGWLKLDAAKFSGKVLNAPSRENLDPSINEHLIIEFYSR